MCQTCVLDGQTSRHTGNNEIKHGTYAGYRAHQNRKVPMCDDCRAAARVREKGERGNVTHRVVTVGLDADTFAVLDQAAEDGQSVGELLALIAAEWSLLG